MAKAPSKDKGVLTLVPILKIDKIYAQLAGSKIYSTLDLRSSYYHILLSKELQKKSAFVVPMGKFEFWKVIFGLAQAPAYLQRLVIEVFIGIDFDYRYLDDILIYRPAPEFHLKCVEIVFQCLLESGLKLKEI